MDNEYYKRYEPFFGAWYIKRYIGAGSYGKVFEIERRDFDMVFTGALRPSPSRRTKASMSRCWKPAWTARAHPPTSATMCRS